MIPTTATNKAERHHFEPDINNQCHECKAEEYDNQPWKPQHFPGLVRGNYSTDCPTCSGIAEGTATYATGDVEMGGGYMPYDGELMKIVYLRCEACEWDQAS